MLRKIMLNIYRNNLSFFKKIFPQKFIDFVKNKLIWKEDFNFKKTKKINKKFETGINYIGYLKAATGLGQGSRLLANALTISNLKISLINNFVDDNADKEKEFENKMSNKYIYNVNLFHIIPGTAFNKMLVQQGIGKLKGRYNIAYWMFELEDIPLSWQKSIKYVNEIWTPSKYAANAFKKVSSVPVYTIPYGIKAEINNNLTRKDFNIPEDKFVFLAMYCSWSTIERKNPLGVIDAYCKAFGDNDNTCLVIKGSYTEPKEIELLKEKTKNIKNFIFIDEIMPKENVNSLISLCDVFVSLHRSEGFGLVMAESMLLGTVCIATNYSANVDFMNKNNSCLVDYKMISANAELLDVYTEDKKWADPDIKQASYYMKKLYSDKRFYNKLKRQAKKDIEENFSIEKCKEKVENRFNEIKKEQNLE